MRLLTLSAAFASLCILSSGSPTSVVPTKYTTIHEESITNTLTQTQSFSKRSGPHAFADINWGNGWVSQSITYCALLPVNRAAIQLGTFFAGISRLSSTFPSTLSAGHPAIYNGMRGQVVRFKLGELELMFFSANSLIPWSFVGTVAARLSQNAAMGYTGLHGSLFVNEVMGMAVFVTLTAAGVPKPWTSL